MLYDKIKVALFFAAMFAIILLSNTWTHTHAQFTPTEYPCQAGQGALPAGITTNNVTGASRNYFCFDSAGNLYISALQYHVAQVQNASGPTCSFNSGGGTSPSCSFASGSGDSFGQLLLVTGTGAPAATGTFTINFAKTLIGSANGNGNCIFGPDPVSTAWNGQAVILGATGTVGVTANWSNNAIALSVSSTYRVNYFCFGH